MSHVFISYSKKNKIYARELTDKLLELGFDVWIDDRIDFGDEWWSVMKVQPPVSLSGLSAILPPPFEWCWIPAGPVTLIEGGYVPKSGQTFDVPAFAIAKYPVTNAQFRKFVDAGGYRQQQWWTPEGWQVREKEKWTQPRYWTDSKWNGADYPVVGVSWYEAMAFCKWLTETEGTRYIVSLPTEQQWQRAAQGDDGRDYPWGNEVDTNRCNVNQSGIGQTTSVTRYPSGASPYGVMDTVGNVLEWCLTDYHSGLVDVNNQAKYRVLRGGCWEFLILFARCASRSWSSPRRRSDPFGFRVAGIPV